jgi:hypothetical protein
MSQAKANNAGRPKFDGNYMNYPKFDPEWWVCRNIFHGQTRAKLMAKVLKEKSISVEGLSLVGSLDSLQKRSEMMTFATRHWRSMWWNRSPLQTASAGFKAYGCSVSRGRPFQEDKRMVLEHTHGLFIT